MNTDLIFLHGVLSSAALVECRAGVRGTRAKPRCKPELLLGSMVAALSGVRLNPEGLERIPEGIGLLPGVMEVSALGRGFAGAQELTVVLLSWVHIFPIVSCFDRGGVTVEGVGVALLICLSSLHDVNMHMHGGDYGLHPG